MRYLEVGGWGWFGNKNFLKQWVLAGSLNVVGGSEFLRRFGVANTT